MRIGKDNIYDVIEQPIPVNEKQRLKALQDYQILNTLNEEDFDRITELASLICEVPISLISLIDENKQWFKSKVGLDVSETSRDLAFCRYAILDTAILEVEDATQDERFKDNELVTGDVHIRFYAGCPLIDPHGFALGTLCVIDHKPKKLNSSQKRALELLAQEVIILIVERRQKEELKNFEKLFELSNDLLFVGGTDSSFIKVNPAFEKVLGWDKDILLNTSTLEFIHPDDIESTQHEMQKLSEGFACVNYIQRFRTSNNQYISIQWTYSPDPLTGKIFGIGRDITEIVKKELQLAISEEKLRSFFEHSQGLMCTHDLKGNFISVNLSGASLLGYTKEELLKMSLFDIVPEERHPFLTTYLTNIINNGKASGQMITRHKDGTFLIWVYNNVLEDLLGQEAYIIGNAIDITEKHNLEIKLAKTRQMLEQTNKVARVGGWEYNTETKDLNWSSITKEIYHVDANFEPELSSRVSFYKEGKDRDSIALALNSALTEGKPWDLELQITNNQGKDVWVRTLGNPEFENGKLKRLYGAIQDIDNYKRVELNLKQSIETQEELNNVLIEHMDLIVKQDKTIETIQEFKFLADSIPQIIWTSLPDGNLDYYNQHWFDYTGLTLEQTLGWGWEPVLHPDDLENCVKAWTKSYTTGSPYEVEYRFKRASDGVYKWHLGRALPMRNENGEIVKWFGSCTDIDEYKRALDLENKITQYEDFNRIVAHNLRGPAGSIEMMLEMISESEDEADKNDLFEMLRESSKTLNGTLDELMNVLEIRLSKHIEFNDCDLSEIISGVGKMLNGQILSKKAVITTQLDFPVIYFPKIYLESIVYNMISNSLKYSNSEIAPIINISSAKINGKVVLRFKDNGLGIDLKKHGMNMFKLNKVFHKGFDSKGVGLFMTKTQIETFGGSIEVESEPNVGTEFIITL